MSDVGDDPEVGLSNPVNDRAISTGYRMVETFPGGELDGLSSEAYLDFILQHENGKTIVRQ